MKQTLILILSLVLTLGGTACTPTRTVIVQPPRTRVVRIVRPQPTAVVISRKYARVDRGPVLIRSVRPATTVIIKDD